MGLFLFCIFTMLNKNNIMKNVKFYQAVLKEIPTNKIIEHCYPVHHKEITLEERLGDCKCPECNTSEWWLLPNEGAAVREGGKNYIECIGCGYHTHL